MSEQRARYSDGNIRTFDPARAGQLHAELVTAIERFLSNHPDTLKAEVLEALRSVRVGYENDVYPM